MGEYIPQAPINDEAKQRNKELPGMGGVFNYVNPHAYHYAGNNPVRYIDQDGEKTVIIYIYNKNDFWNGIAGGAHVALWLTDPGPTKRNDAGQPIIYDPSGSYSSSEQAGFGGRPTSAVFEGYAENLEDYINFHLDKGAIITMYIIDTTREQEARMAAFAVEYGESYFLFPLSCAKDVSAVLAEIGIKRVRTPGGLKNQMESWVSANKAQKVIHEKKPNTDSNIENLDRIDNNR
jgi:hypothetical protein